MSHLALVGVWSSLPLFGVDIRKQIFLVIPCDDVELILGSPQTLEETLGVVPLRGVVLLQANQLGVF